MAARPRSPNSSGSEVQINEVDVEPAYQVLKQDLAYPEPEHLVEPPGRSPPRRWSSSSDSRRPATSACHRPRAPTVGTIPPPVPRPPRAVLRTDETPRRTPPRFAPKGRNKPARGNAPGTEGPPRKCPERAAQGRASWPAVCRPFRARIRVGTESPGRCPGLICFGPFGAKIRPGRPHSGGVEREVSEQTLRWGTGGIEEASRPLGDQEPPRSQIRVELAEILSICEMCSRSSLPVMNSRRLANIGIDTAGLTPSLAARRQAVKFLAASPR